MKPLLKHVTVVSITIENIEISDKIHRKFKEYGQSQILEYLHKLKVKSKFFKAMNICFIYFPCTVILWKPSNTIKDEVKCL